MSSWLLLLISILRALSGKHLTHKGLCLSNKLKMTSSGQFISWQEKDMKRMWQSFIPGSYFKFIAFKIVLSGGNIPVQSFHTVKVNVKKIKGSWETGKYKIWMLTVTYSFKSWNLAIWYILRKYQLWEGCQSQEKDSCPKNGKENGVLKYKL